MDYETDYALLARTNPVFLTAKTAVCLMAEAGIPYAADIVQKLGRKNLLSLKDAAEQANMTETAFCQKAGMPLQQ